jgi:hypothetical protein
VCVSVIPPAAFLCSDAAEMIIGQTIYVDGGFSLLTDYFPSLEEQEITVSNAERITE